MLDIGCDAGFYSVALAQRGAEVLAIDIDEHYLRQAHWVRERFRISRTQLALRRMHVYELGRLEEGATRRSLDRGTGGDARARSAGLEPVGSPGHEITLARRTGPPCTPADLRAVLGDTG